MNDKAPALDHLRKTLDIAADHIRMASMFLEQGNQEKALEHFRKALDIQLATLGDKHPDTAKTYTAWARCL
jgi:Tfp pilus assembly protein PilF